MVPVLISSFLNALMWRMWKNRGCLSYCLSLGNQGLGLYNGYLPGKQRWHSKARRQISLQTECVNLDFRCDPQLEELLENHQAIVSNLTDSRVGSMLVIVGRLFDTLPRITG